MEKFKQMKKYISLLYLLFAALFVFGQVPGELKWKKNIAKNHIQTQTQWNHKYEKGKPQKKGYQNYSKRFDLNGNVIEETYLKSGYVNKKLSYKYDNNENKVEFVNYRGSANEVIFKQNISYDNSSRKIREERYNGKDYQIIKYTYDNKNRLIKTVRSDIFGDIEHQRVFNYSGNTCNISIIEGKSHEIGKIANKYDNNNNIIESIEYDDKGKIKNHYKYSFKGKLLIEKTKYILGNFIYKESYNYNSNKNLVKVLKEQPKGKVITDKLYKYDTKGNLIEEQWYDKNPDENSKKTYFYNKKGVLEKVEVYYSLYKYRIQYKYKYKFY